MNDTIFIISSCPAAFIPFFKKYENIVCFYVLSFFIFYCFSALTWHRNVHGRQGTVYNQYHDCWYPNGTRSQDISSYDIDLILTEYSGCITALVSLCTIINRILSECSCFSTSMFKNHPLISFCSFPPILILWALTSDHCQH